MLLDTDLLIDVKRGHAPAVAWATVLPEEAFVAGIAATELANGSRKATELRDVMDFLADTDILWPGEPDMEYALSHIMPTPLPLLTRPAASALGSDRNEGRCGCPWSVPRVSCSCGARPASR